MSVLSFAAMYAPMYAMVNRFDNVLFNVNQVYLAGLMTAAMVIIELALMWGMYRQRILNAVILVASVSVLICLWMLIRFQTGVADEKFLKSMIPHHASALLMCETASISDPEIKSLCESIRDGQQTEIDQMKRLLSELQKRGK